MQFKISKEQLDLLISHSGYGIGETNNDKVKILIIGNESGTGDAINSEEYIKGLEGKVFRKKTRTGNYLTKSDFLQFIGRIVRALEEKEGQWFAPKDSCNVWNEIISGDFYSESAHLFDIRPLPRTTENETWPYENIDKKSYELGFKNLKSKDTFIEEMISLRINFLQSQIKSYPNLKYIIAPGAVPMKKKFLEMVFPQLKFNSVEIKTSKKTMTYYKGNVGELVILVCPFFKNLNGIGYEGLEQAFELIK
jgi:hypothetical protein